MACLYKETLDRLNAPQSAVIISGSNKDDDALVKHHTSEEQRKELVERFLIVHELTHLRHPDHTRTFWAALGRFMPDYESRKARLRVLGPQLEW